jgi:uncharacterized protein (DUF433 family)
MTEMFDIGTLIHFPGARSARPCLAGTGMSVYRVVDYHRAGLTPEEMQAEIPDIPLSHFYAALAFYFANQRFCDEQMETRDREAERAYTANVALRKVKAG